MAKISGLLIDPAACSVEAVELETIIGRDSGNRLIDPAALNAAIGARTFHVHLFDDNHEAFVLRPGGRSGETTGPAWSGGDSSKWFSGNAVIVGWSHKPPANCDCAYSADQVREMIEFSHALEAA